jgi:hypothetical protein
MSQNDPEERGVRAEETEAQGEEALELEATQPADLSEESGAVLDSSVRMSSEALYIVREINFLAELAEDLAEHGIELREEVAEGGSEVPKEQPETERV